MKPATIGCLFPLCLLILGFCAYVLTRPSIGDLEEQGNMLVAAIDRYRVHHGVYPTTPSDAGIELPTTPYGQWKYHVFNDRADFELSVGEYQGLSPFVLFWNSAAGEWYLDK